MDEKKQDQFDLEGLKSSDVPQDPAEQQPAEEVPGAVREEAAQCEETAENILQAQPESEAEEPVFSPDQKPTRPKGGKRWKRRTLSFANSLLFIAIMIALNIVVSALTERFPSLNIDLTEQKLNTLSDQAVKAAKAVKEETTLTLIGEEKSYRKDQLYSSYGIKYSQVSNLADRLHEVNSKITVRYLDPDTNPDFVNQYPGESLYSGSVMVSTEKRYKVLTADDLFAIESGANYSKVDSALAGALESVGLERIPVAVIATGHQEVLTDSYLSAFTELLEGQNFEVRTWSVMTEDLPEDAQMVMLPTPSADYTPEEIEKLRSFLGDETRQEPLSLWVTCYPTQGELPNLEAFLQEWGITLEAGVVAETNSSRMFTGSPTLLFVDSDWISLSENTYQTLISPNSRPLALSEEAPQGVSLNALWTTSEGAYTASDSESDSSDTSQHTVAAIASKSGEESGSRNVVVFGSSEALIPSFLGTSAFGNRQYFTDLLRETSDFEGSSVTVEPQQVATYTLDITISSFGAWALGIGVFTIGLPAVILVVGLVTFFRRRHL